MIANYLIVPAWSSQAGRCRIVMRRSLDRHIADCLKDYRSNPDFWSEAGLMNSHGELVHLTAPKHVVQEFKDCQPLMAGIQMHFECFEESDHVTS